MFYNFLTVAIRNAMRHKFYAIISLSSLAIGLTCAVLIMLSIRYEMSYDAFRPHADRVYRIMKRDIDARGQVEWRGALPSEIAVHLRDEYPEVEAVVQFRRITSWFRAEDRLFQQRLCPVDGDAVDFFGLDIIRGDATALKRRDASIVLTQSVAQKLYGHKDPIGRTVEVQRETYQQVFTVVAVMKDRPTNTRLEFDSVTFFASDNWAIRTAPIYVRLRPDADVAALEHALVARFPSESQEATYHLQALPRVHLYSRIDLEGFTGDSGMPYRDVRDLYPLSVLGVGILLIACINFMNLATARSAIRAREIGLRKVVGARRQHIMGQFLCESVLFTGVALPVSFGLTVLLLPQFSGLMGQPLVFNIFDHVWWIVCIALVTALVSGSYPAFYLSAQQPVDALKGLRNRLPGDLWLRKGLVVVQFAVSAILIASTLVVYQQMDLVRGKYLGFDRDEIVVVKIFGPDAEQIRLNGQYNAVKQRFLQHPNIVAAGTSLDLPGHSWPSRRFVSDVEMPDREVDVRVFRANEDFLMCYNIPILSGRNFSQSYAEQVTENSSAMQVVINETAAKRFGWSNPLGHTLMIGERPAQVIGVMGDFHVRSLREPLGPVVLSAAGTDLKYLHLKIKPDRIRETMAFVEETWKHFIPTRPFEYFFIDDYIDSKYRREQRQGHIFTRSAIVAIVLACLGLAGLAAFAAEQRTREIGIRKVLGASASHLVVLISQDFARLAVFASTIACPVGYFLMRNWLQNFAYRVDLGFFPFVVSALGVVVATILVVGYQVYKAASANPAEVLRRE
ncbi:MAG: FtsX-like permease family protein [Gemmatimonadetes bacterium]|nr:FtsX-like permease family protein [Gemmatimonadota bacterium]